MSHGNDDLNEHLSGLARTGMTSTRARGARSRALDTGLFREKVQEEISAGDERPDAGHPEGVRRAMQGDERGHEVRLPADADRELGEPAPSHGGRDLRALLLPDGGGRDGRADLPGDQNQGGRDGRAHYPGDHRDLQGLQGALMWQGPLLPTTLDQGGEAHYDPVYELEIPPVDPDDDFNEDINEAENFEELQDEDPHSGDEGQEGDQPEQGGEDPEPDESTGRAPRGEEPIEEETPEIDESVESQDEQEFGEYDSSSPFSEAPNVPTPSPDDDGRIPQRFNVFGAIPQRRLRRSPPSGPYGPRSSTRPVRDVSSTRRRHAPACLLLRRC